MIILGIDPGSRAMGLGLVRLDGAVLSHLASEVVRVPVGGSAARLAHIHKVLAERIGTWRPDRVAVEAVFAAKSVRSALQLGQARGVALAVCGLAGIDCDEYAPTQVKQAVCGTGTASKAQVQAMVQRLLALDARPPSDAADALAVAICHGHAGGSRGAARIAAAQRAQA